MAVSNSFFGLRRGSTKSHTYTVFNGKQVTKDRVTEVKNPRTSKQMAQRMLLATVGALYKTLRPICDHSYEGKTYGLQSMNYFMSENLKAIQANAKADPQTWNFNAYGNANARPNPVKVSEGTLSPYPEEITAASLGAATFPISLVPTGTTMTVGAVKAFLGINANDYITFVALAVDKTAKADYNGVEQANNAKLMVVRFYMPSAADDTAVTAANFNELFEPQPLNATVQTFVAEDNGITVAAPTGMSIEAACIIKSSQGSGKWLRSTERLSLSEEAKQAYATVLASYPIANEYILNGGDF